MNRIGSAGLRFMESLHDFDAAHWDHEPRRVRSAGFRACGFGDFPVARSWSTGLESPVNPQAGKSALQTGFMESLHDFDAAHWDYEPLTACPGFSRPKPFEPPKGGTPNQ